MKPKNKIITIPELGEQRQFVSGNKFWYLDWVKVGTTLFEPGQLVSWFDDEDNKTIQGIIMWFIIIDDGSVEVAIDAPMGRLPITEINHVKS